MASDQSRYFIVPSADLEEVKATIHEAFPEALVGSKPHEEGTAVVVVTLFSEAPEGLGRLMSALGTDSLEVSPPPPVRSLSDLVQELKRIQGQET